MQNRKFGPYLTTMCRGKGPSPSCAPNCGTTPPSGDWQKALVTNRCSHRPHLPWSRIRSLSVHLWWIYLGRLEVIVISREAWDYQQDTVQFSPQLNCLLVCCLIPLSGASWGRCVRPAMQIMGGLASWLFSILFVHCQGDRVCPSTPGVRSAPMAASTSQKTATADGRSSGRQTEMPPFPIQPPWLPSAMSITVPLALHLCLHPLHPSLIAMLNSKSPSWGLLHLSRRISTRTNHTVTSSRTSTELHVHTVPGTLSRAMLALGPSTTTSMAPTRSGSCSRCPTRACQSAAWRCWMEAPGPGCAASSLTTILPPTAGRSPFPCRWSVSRRALLASWGNGSIPATRILLMVAK
jgi:hypothetical protein